MAEVLVRYVTGVIGPDGSRFIPQACGGIAKDGLWEGWIEFVGEQGAFRTGRETEQTNRDALMYWAQGLTAAYLEGALARATTPRTVLPREPLAAHPRFERPAPPPPTAFRPRRAILDPFSTFAQGEDLLRRQLNALSHDNLVAIVDDHDLPVRVTSDMSSRRLIEAIIESVKADTATAARTSVERPPSHTEEQRP